MSLTKAIERMHDETCLELRGAVYWFRIRVPVDLQEEIGRAEIRHTLKTKDKREAKRLAAERKVELRKQWEALRKRLKEGPRRSITPEETQAIVERMVSNRLAADEEDRAGGVPFPQGDHEAALAAHTESTSRDAVAGRGYSSHLSLAIEDWLTHFGFQLKPNSEEFKRFAYAFAKGHRQVLEAQRKRSEGDVVPTPAAPALDAPIGHCGVKDSRSGHSLADALHTWKRLKNPALSSVEVYEAAAAKFEGQNPGVTIEETTKAHIRKHIEFLLSDGLSPKTIEKEHGALRTLYGIAENEEWIAANPAKGLILPTGEAAKKRSYTPTEVSNILASPVFAEGKRPKAGKGEAAFWVPLLLLFTGARREEICQLELDRIREEEGVPYIAIDPRDDSGRVKTEESKRSVPVHPGLVRIGFLKYVQQRRREGGTRLFPALNKPNKRGQVGAKWGDWWARYIRQKVGITDERIQPSHGFRHLFITECRRLRFREDYERALVGHAAGSGKTAVHDNYGEHLVPELAKEVARIDFRGVDFSVLSKRRN